MNRPRCNSIARQHEIGGSCQADEAPLHLCPFSETVDESDEQCTCCADCTQRCQENI